jgi:hypothetical protein
VTSRYAERQEYPLSNRVVIITGLTVAPSPKQACSQFIKPALAFAAKYVFTPVMITAVPVDATIPNRTRTHQVGATTNPRKPNPPATEPITRSNPSPIRAIMGPLLKLTPREKTIVRSIS